MNKFYRLSAAVLFLGSSLALPGADLTFRDAKIGNWSDPEACGAMIIK